MKWPTMEHLQLIAKLNGSYAPATIRLTPWQVFPDNTVLKRSNSECGYHVILPNEHYSIHSWAYLNQNAGKGDFWMVQQYVQSLDHIGEWRVLLVGGGIMSVMHTHKTTAKDWRGDWAGTATDDFLTLQEIRCVTPY